MRRLKLSGLVLLLCTLLGGSCSTRCTAMTSEVKRHNGLPALFVNGKLTSSLTFYANNAEGARPFS